MLNAEGILSADKLSAFKSRLQQLGLLAENNGADTQQENALHVNGPGVCSPTEERAWMLHQQDPLSAAGPFVSAFRLVGELDVARLEAAIHQLFSADSNLNLRFALNEAGELTKQHRPEDAAPVVLHKVNSINEAINYLLLAQQRPMDLQHKAAIQFFLLPFAADELVLGILGHHILLDDSAWQPIFTRLSQLYDPHTKLAGNTGSFFQIAPVDTKVAIQHWAQEFPNGLRKSELPLWLQANSSPLVIEHFDKTNAFATAFTVKRYQARMSAASLTVLASRAQVSVFHGLCGLFGIYLSHLLGQSAVTLLFPTVGRSGVQELNSIEPSSNVLPVLIEASFTSLDDALVQVRNKVLQATAHNIPFEQILTATKSARNSLPNLLITEFVDSSHFLQLPGIAISHLSVPPIGSDYDLILAFQQHSNETITLELTTGKFVSPVVGATLLENFIRFIETHNSQVIPTWKNSNAAHLLPDSLHASEGNAAGNNSAENFAAITDDIDLDLAECILSEFKTILGMPELEIHDDFFEFGGHSLLATRVIGKLKTVHGIEVSIADFFNASTAATLSGFALRSLDNIGIGDLQASPDSEAIPASLLQSAYLPGANFGADTIFNIPFALRFSQPVDEAAFRHAFEAVIFRHQTLRSLFVMGIDGKLLQRIIPIGEVANYAWFDFSINQASEDVENELQQQANYSFDLRKEFPIRVRFFKDENNVQVLSILLYHMSFDEWSAGILIEEVFHAYRSFVQGKEPVWNYIPAQYKDFAIAQSRSGVIEQQLPYWLNYLGKIPQAKPIFQTSQQDLTVLNEVDVTGSYVDFSISESEFTGLSALSAAHHCSLFHVIYAAIAMGLYFVGAGKKILIGTSISGRENPLFHDTIGFFTNVVMHHTELTEELPVEQLLHQVRDRIIAAAPYSEIPFGIVEQQVSLQPLRSALDNLCEIYLQFHPLNQLNEELVLDDGSRIQFKLLEPPRNTSKFGLHFEVYEQLSASGRSIRGVINYRCRHYNATQIKIIQDVTQHILSCLGQMGERGDNLSVRDLRRQLGALM